MKLLDKSTRYYLVYSLFVLSIGSLFFYFSVQHVIKDGIDEALRQEKLALVNNLNYENNLDSLILNSVTFIQSLGVKDRKEYEKYYTISTKDNDTLQHNYRQLESVFKHEGSFYLLKIKQSLKEEEELLQSIVPIGIVMFLILLVGVLIISNFISARVWSPFYSILNKLGDYDIKKGTIIDYQKMSINEFDQLSHSLHLMTTEISEDFKRQKEFSENFSHELQTPLAIIQNNLELIIQSPNLQENEMNHIGGILDAVKRITSLSKGLLLLSRIDNNQFIEFSKIDLVTGVKKMVAFFNGITEDRGIVVKEHYSESVIVYTNHILADILVSNLISNAIRHNIDNGYITIEVNRTSLVVSNSGKPLDGDVSTIFDRFVKLGEKKNSIGLGLPIVKKICEVSGFTVKYENIGSVHTVSVLF